MKFRHKIAALSIGIASSGAYALQLGEVHSASRLGEPLDAYVQLVASAHDDFSAARLEVLPDLIYINNRSLTKLVTGFRAGIGHDRSGLPYIHVQSNAPVTEPLVAFRLKVFQGDRALIRHYSLAPSAPFRPAKTSAAARGRATSDGGATTRVDYGPVRRGETLWGIARRISNGTGSDVGNIVQSLFAANPQAFIRGDIDKLRIGAVLKVPAAKPLAGKTTPEDVETFAARPAGSVAQQEPATRMITEPGVENAGSPPTSVTSAPAKWQTGDPELAARLSSLEQKYAAIRTRYGSHGRRQTAAAVSRTAAPVSPSTDEMVPEPRMSERTIEPPDTVDDRVRESGVVADTASGAGEPSLKAVPATTRQDIARPGAAARSVSGGLPGSIYDLLIYAFAAILLIGLLIMAIRTGLTAYQRRHATMNLNTAEKSRRAAVQRKAADRLRLERQVKHAIEGHKEHRASMTQEQKPEAGDRLTTIERAVEQPLTKGSEREILIDTNIAHGRYLEAEKLLRCVITETPRNYAAKLRLAEIYYMTERIDKFLDTTNDLYENHRPELADDDWQRVMRMGKVIAPDRPLFSGPQAIDQRSTAS